MDYSQKLKQVRVSERLSQSEMAKKIGVSQQVYCSAEGGKVKKVDYKIVVFLENLLKLQEKDGAGIAAIEAELPEILGDYEARIAILESFMEVSVPEIAEIKAKVKPLADVDDKEIVAEIATLKGKIRVISKKKFHELQSKLF